MDKNELSPTAKRMAEQTNNVINSNDAETSRSTIGKMAYEVGVTAKFISQLVSASSWVWINFFLPAWTFIFTGPGRWFVNKWVELWRWFTPYKDKFGNTKFSRTKGGIMILGTLMLPFVLFQMMLFTADASLYFATVKRDQVVWLSSAQEIIPGENTFSVQGCEKLVERADGSKTCSEANTLYYRVSPSALNQIWSLFAGHGVFFPDRVVAAVGADWSQCEIESYGIRFRLFMFLLDVYPNLLTATCTRNNA